MPIISETGTPLMSPAGVPALAGCAEALRCCTPGGGDVRCYRMLRCGTVLCPPPSVPAVRFACSSTPPAEGLVVIDQRLLICYVWDGQPPLPVGTVPPEPPANAGPLIAVVNGACSADPCTRDLCNYFLELRPCTSDCSFAPVRVFQRLSQYRGAVPVGSPPGVTPARVCCYCAGNSGVFSSEQIPAGSIIVPAGAGGGRTFDCCTCRGVARSLGGAGDAACGVDRDPPSGPTCCCGRATGLTLTIGTIAGLELRVHEQRGCGEVAGTLGRVARCGEIELRDQGGGWIATLRNFSAACGMGTGSWGFSPGSVQYNPAFDSATLARVRAAVESLLQVFQIESSACDRVQYRTFPSTWGDQYVVTVQLVAEGRGACLACAGGGAGGAGFDPLELY